MSETPEEYWKRMQPEIHRRFEEGLKNIQNNIDAHPGPLDLAKAEITRLRSLLQEAVEALEKLFSDSDESDFQDDGFDNIHVGWRDYKNICAIITKIKEQ